ncbi:putative periplasmic sensor hybrid histidine kinase [Magnetofaba australis IT-1]|uniref:histidine kinase n=1 Tax=Magnetofaba australis IT-1 TaxID=1434232 RepID=A0A1Y2KBA4_9PROT|nr:putative periplasmic sensor hybrid histidine kinase [Magnetofaba australis IT-1]
MWQEERRYQDALRVDVIDQLSTLRAQLEREINRHFHLTRGLIAYVQVHPDIDQADFHGIAAGLLRHNAYIRNIGLAPGDILKYVHPIQGNEKSIGLDYRANNAQWPAISRAIGQRRTVVAGPVNLVQGGVAFISRTPVYIPPQGGEPERYWGLASIVIDQQRLYQQAGLREVVGGVRVALRGRDGNGEQGDVFFGDAALFSGNAVRQTVHLPDGSWVLAGAPLAGWSQPSPHRTLMLFGSLILSLIMGLWIRWHLLVRHRYMERIQAADRSKNEFLANMSHEIRTPMNVILGMSELLLAEETDPRRKSYLETAHSAGEGLLSLINDILDIAKIEAGELEMHPTPLQIPTLVHAIARIFQQEASDKRLELITQLDDGLPEWVMGDAHRLRQVLINLVGNALKFTPAGQVAISVRRSGDICYRFAVTDTGIGIPADKLEHVFQPFSQADATITRRFGGSGLGLAICRDIVQKMGGKMAIESQEGAGSTIAFELPLPACPAPVEENPAHGIASETPIAPMGLSILVAEDSEDNVALLRAYTHKSPHRLTVVNNGRQAVDAFCENTFDLVLMDVQMPLMDGYAATQEIRNWERMRQRAPTPIWALSAHAYDEARNQSLRAGCDGHLTKPIKKRDLMAFLADIAARSDAPARNASPQQTSR